MTLHPRLAYVGTVPLLGRRYTVICRPCQIATPDPMCRASAEAYLDAHRRDHQHPMEGPANGNL